MNYIEAVILYCLKEIKGERTIFSIFHLLKGKRSSQTIQDAHLYSLASLFYTYPLINRDRFMRMVSGLHEKNLIIETEKEKYILTEQGVHQLGAFFNERPYPASLNGWLYGTTVEVLWKRLSLLIQVLSHYIRASQQYYPIQREREVQRWIKTFLYEPPLPLKELNTALYSDIVSLARQESFPDDPELLVSRLTGGEFIGLTRGQAAERAGLEEDEYWYRFWNVLHYTAAEVTAQKEKYPVLYALISDLVPEITLTHSSEETYKLLKRGDDIKRISELRRLKESTIEDHIVEIALNDKEFSIERFVPESDIDQILHKAREVNKRKLKPIKDALPQLSYFQIRLTLARYGDKL
ncbi:helix-turn-helix domain-containing protein [Bacillus sp. P14.5]|uniref:helix-turn-helix domain-containing protein n=1 Tax=Bacillus sp. P14.5 TaxID=1983400 RepID=UPI000DE8927B|nr:helix-turn-helix domain-containing protein [Bacillus sp. P14.5]